MSEVRFLLSTREGGTSAWSSAKPWPISERLNGDDIIRGS